MLHLAQKQTTSPWEVYFISFKSRKAINFAINSNPEATLFIYNDKLEEIEIINTYYGPPECCHFLFKTLGVFRPISKLKFNLPSSLK